jgi:hypothetical protein
MSEKHSANMILSLTRRNQVYLPYARKKPYFEAIAAGNAEAVDRLAEKNSGYTAALSAKMEFRSLSSCNEIVSFTIDAPHLMQKVLFLCMGFVFINNVNKSKLNVKKKG